MSADQFFRASPFSLTASPETAGCWAGRNSVLSRLERLKRSMLHRSDSSLDLIWANLGAGKSHVLFYLEHLLKGSVGESVKIIPVFVEMPDQVKKFHDLYMRILAELPLDTVARMILDTENRTIPGDLKNCARALVHGSGEEKAVARQWLLGQRPSLRDLKASTKIQSRIEEDSQACEILGGIITALADNGIRLVVLLDEFQRVASLQPQHRRETVLSNLRSLFSRNPRYFSLVVAIKSRIEATAMDMLSEELRTLMGVRPCVSLPEMSPEEAMQFVVERFRFFRPEGYEGKEDAPFGFKIIEMVITHIARIDGPRLIPRTILQALGWIDDEAVTAESDEVDPDEAKVLLEELRWEALD